MVLKRSLAPSGLLLLDDRLALISRPPPYPAAKAATRSVVALWAWLNTARTSGPAFFRPNSIRYRPVMSLCWSVN